MATEQLANATETEWKQSQLERMKRDEIESIAERLKIHKPHLAKRKTDLVFAILEAQGKVVDDPNTLNMQQKEFCRLYITESEFSGNGVESYIEAYNYSTNAPGAYETAKANASRLLKKPNIIAHMNELLAEHALNDVSVDKQLSFLINQQADLKTKLGAIKEYNTMKERVQRNQPVVNMNFYSFSDKQAKKVIEAHEQWVLDNTRAIIDVEPES